MQSPRRWIRPATIGFGVFSLTVHPEMASAAEPVPYSATNVPLSTGSPTFSVDLDLLTVPNRPQLHVRATPDAGHSNMTLEILVDGCPFFGGDCIDFTNGDPLTWSSNSAPGTVDWVAPIWQCVPAPADSGITGTQTPQCTLHVTAAGFGSGGSPATFDLEIEGETHPVTGTVETVVDPVIGTTGEQDLPLGRVPFCTDAANFRWIYDEEDDDVVETFQPVTHAQLGKCTGLIGDDTDIFGPRYRYDYLGSPAYVGFDCCTWQVDSPDTGTTGSGQALFYLNTSLSSPPPDTDGDGFFDPCDNCVNVPNGPFLGTCVTPVGVTDGSRCLSDQQCGVDEFCSMAQEDDDFDPAQGIVCLPEPEETMLLSAGLLGLAALERLRRRRTASLTASC